MDVILDGKPAMDVILDGKPVMDVILDGKYHCINISKMCQA